MKAGYVETFAAHGAELRNPQWSFCARGRDGSIVLSCWTPFFVPKSEHGIEGVLRYRDRLSRVSHNSLGAGELKAFLQEAMEHRTPFRLIVGRAADERALVSGKSASSPKNQFHAKRDLIGELVAFDGDEYVIDFKRAT